jgi:hypothetical protein
MSIQDCKSILELGHREDQQGLPQAILVVGQVRWEQIVKSYGSWAGLAMFHYYDSTINAGEVPGWLTAIKGHGTKLIHEIRPGEIYLLTYNEPNFIYRYFVDSPPPAGVSPQPVSPVYPPTYPPSNPPEVTPRKYTIKGKFGRNDVNLTVEIE